MAKEKRRRANITQQRKIFSVKKEFAQKHSQNVTFELQRI